MNVIVVQYETRRDTALRLLMKYTRDYCLQHGYTYMCPTDEYDLPLYWIKVKLIQDLFNSVPADRDVCVAWIDSDAVFVRTDITVESILQQAHGRDFVTSLDPGSTTDMNAGVFFIRRTDEMRELVNDWMNCYKPERWSKSLDAEGKSKWTTQGRWAGPDYEQGSFNTVILPKYRHEIALLPEKVFACYEPVYGRETIVCHFMYTHKWKIWVYNGIRRSPELFGWVLLGIAAMLIQRALRRRRL